MIPKEEILMLILCQPRKLRGITEIPLPSWPTGGRAGFGARTGMCQGLWHCMTRQGAVGRVTSPSGNKGEQPKTPGRRGNGEGGEEVCLRSSEKMGEQISEPSRR